MKFYYYIFAGSISNIDGDDECSCSKSKKKVISGVVGASSSVTSIQVANLLRLFRIPQVTFIVLLFKTLNYF
jgi:metabotropic X receptor